MTVSWMDQEGAPGQIVGKMIDIMSEIGAIEKGKKNPHFGYQFRGIEDVQAKLQPLLVKHRVLLVPLAEEVDAQQVGKSTRITIKVRHRWIAEDGTYIDTVTVGQGDDTGDKAANKAESGAFKYAVLEALCIPSKEMKDSEEESPTPVQDQEKLVEEYRGKIHDANNEQDLKTVARELESYPDVRAKLRGYFNNKRKKIREEGNE